MQTASGTAESDVAGVFMNMVTKSGGNRFTSDHNFYFMNDALQGTNIDDDLRARLGLAAGTGRPARPATRSTSATTGARRSAARSLRDKAVVLRRHPLVAAGSVPDRRQQPRRLAGHRRQPHPQLRRQGDLADHAAAIRTSFAVQQEHQRSLPSPRRALPVRRGQGDRCCRTSRRRTTSCSYNHVARPRGWCSTRASAGCGACSRSRYQPEVQPTDIAIRDVVRIHASTPPRPAVAQPERPLPGQLHRQLLPRLGRARHATTSRPALQFSWERRASTSASATATPASSCSDGVGFQAQLSNTPINSDHRLKTWGVVPAGPLDVRPRHHQRRPARRRRQRLPAGADQPAGTYVERPQLRRRPTSSTSGPNVAPRLGVTYDLFGNGRTALKAYYGRFYNQFGSADRRGRQPQRHRQPGGVVDRHQRQPGARSR